MDKWEPNLLSGQESSDVENDDPGGLSESQHFNCFLCLSDISTGLNTEDGTLILPERFSLLRICHYLKLERKEETEDFSVNLCQQCLAICATLSSLCSELELIQMKINHKLEKFSGKLDNLEDGRGHPSGKDDDVTFLKRLRQQLKTNSHRKLKSVLPQVILTRATIQERSVPPKLVPTVTTAGSTSKLWKCPTCPFQFNHRKNLYVHQRQKHNIPLAFQNFTCASCHSIFPQKSDFLLHTTNPDCPLPSRKDGTQITFQKCNHCVPPKNVEKRVFQRHRILHHVESFFPDLNLWHFSVEQFKLYIEHVLKFEMISAQKLPNSEGIPIPKCPHCSNMYQDKIAFRTHLLQVHQQILEQKILDLTKSKTVADIKRMSFNTGPEFPEGPINPATFSKPSKCTLCNPPRKVKTWNFKRHKIDQHVEIFFGDSKLPHVSKEHFKLYCEHAFKMEMVSSNQKCAHCSTDFRDYPWFRRHCVLSHQEIFAGKIMELQKNCSVVEIKRLSEKAGRKLKVKCTACGTTFSNNWSLSRHKKSFCKVKVEPETVSDNQPEGPTIRTRTFKTCNDCKPPRDIQTNIFKRHKMLHHLDTFFVSAKISSLTTDQFKIYCEQALKMELLSCTSVTVPDKDDPSLQCCHCLSRYADPVGMRYHLLYIHQEILKESIVALQGSKTVEEIKALSESSSSFWAIAGKGDGLKCDSCGRRFAVHSSLVRHKKGYCKGAKAASSHPSQTGEIIYPKVEGVTDGNWEEPEIHIPDVYGEDFTDEDEPFGDPLGDEIEDGDPVEEKVTMIVPD